MATLTWLHLSDWHQKSKDFDRGVVRDALIKDIRERAQIDSRLEQIDFAIFSGDVASAAQPSEYQAARTHLFGPILDDAGLQSTPDRLFIVPGNHDLDRQHVYDMLPLALQKPFKSDDEVKFWLTDDERRERLLEPFKAFSQFVRDLTGQQPQDYTNMREWDIAGKRVAVLGLNSAWMCGRKKDEQGNVNDYGFTLLGEPQIHAALDRLACADVRIVVLHHPFDWLAEFDRNRVEERLARAAHFILHGHQHMPKVKITQGTGGDCVIIPAGACYDRRVAENPRYTNAYNLVHLNLDNGQVTVYLRRWSDVRYEWIEDNDSSPDGQYTFSAPKNWGWAPAGAAAPAATPAWQEWETPTSEAHPPTGTVPRRVFISYKRNDTGQELAQFLQDYLRKRGHRVFMDLEMLPGERLWDRIEREIRESDYLIVLLSPESAVSEMVEAEVERAYEYCKQQGHPDILPVRIRYEGMLPLAIDVYVRKAQYVVWRNSWENEAVGNRILQSLQAGRPPRMPSRRVPPGPVINQVTEDGAEVQAGETVARPRPQFDWRHLEDPSRVVSLRNELYVWRDADELVKCQVTSAGTVTTLRAPRQTGKTSLLVRALQHARKAEARVAFVDLQWVESQHLESEDSFLGWLANLIVGKLTIDSDKDTVGASWKPWLSPVHNFTRLMEHHILPHRPEPLVLAIDEVERLVATGSTNGLGMCFPDDAAALNFQNHILGMLHAWSNSMAFGEPWDRLNIILALDTEPYLLIRDPYQSPFNVGVQVRLDDFNVKQVEDLNRRHGSPLGENVRCLMELLNGHPFLTRKALYILCQEGWNWDRLAREAKDDTGPFGDHLRRYYWLLHDHPDQCAALKSVIANKPCDNEEAFHRLERAGLVKGAPANARCRCDLYARYFKDKLK